MKAKMPPTTAIEPPKSVNKSPTVKSASPNSSTFHQTTLHHPQWAYVHLALVVPSAHTTTTSLKSSHRQSEQIDIDTSDNITPADPGPDLLTLHGCMMRALRQYLGLMGAAVPIDVLKHEDREVWVRVPREDAQGFVAALGGWVGSADDGVTTEMVGWRVCKWGYWLGALVGAGGEADVFDGN